MAAGLLVAAFGGGCSSDKLEGRIYLSAIETSDGKTIGLAIDFVPTAGTFSPDKVQIAIDAEGDTLAIGDSEVDSVCHSSPAKRTNLYAFDGELNATSRVRVQAFRSDGAGGAAGAAGTGASGGTGGGAGGMSGAAGGGPSTALPRSGECLGGTLLDDAIWPTRGAQVGPRTGMAGSSAGGMSPGGAAGESGGGAGGEAGSGGEGGVPTDGGMGGMGGAPGGAPTGGVDNESGSHAGQGG